MGRNKTPIPPKVMSRILDMQGAKRVSKEASKVLAEIVLDKALEISKKAIKNSKHAKRNTVNEDDIKLAVNK